jgi:hypothetical protein
MEEPAGTIDQDRRRRTGSVLYVGDTGRREKWNAGSGDGHRVDCARVVVARLVGVGCPPWSAGMEGSESGWDERDRRVVRFEDVVRFGPGGGVAR